MFEKLVDILKDFLEKHFLPFLLSVVITGIVYYVTPSDYSLLIKLEKNFYLSVVFCLSLFLIEILIILIKKIYFGIKQINKEKKYEEENVQARINYLYDMLDELNPEELDLVEYFVENNNQYITTYMNNINIEYNFEPIFNSRRYRVKEEKIVSVDTHDINKTCVFKKGSYVNQFKLRDDIYQDLFNLKKKTGKISRF